MHHCYIRSLYLGVAQFLSRLLISILIELLTVFEKQMKTKKPNIDNREP